MVNDSEPHPPEAAILSSDQARVLVVEDEPASRDMMRELLERAGYAVVNCNPLYSPRELRHQLADSGAEAIVVLENFASTLEKAIDGAPALKTIVVTGDGDPPGA